MKAMVHGFALRVQERRFLLMASVLVALAAGLGACDDPFEGM